MTLGVTGTFGSGKSTFAKLLAEQSGAVIVDADQLSRRSLEQEGAAYERVIETFGPQILNADGSINRQRLADRAFCDKETLERLTTIIHPVVIEQTRRIISEAGSSPVILDVPLLFESGMEGLCEATITLTVPDGIRAERLERGRGLSRDEMRRRDGYQLSDTEKRRRATYVVENNGDLERLRESAERVWKNFQERFVKGETDG